MPDEATLTRTNDFKRRLLRLSRRVSSFENTRPRRTSQREGNDISNGQGDQMDLNRDGLNSTLCDLILFLSEIVKEFSLEERYRIYIFSS